MQAQSASRRVSLVILRQISCHTSILLAKGDIPSHPDHQVGKITRKINDTKIFVLLAWKIFSAQESACVQNASQLSQKHFAIQLIVLFLSFLLKTLKEFPNANIYLNQLLQFPQSPLPPFAINPSKTHTQLFAVGSPCLMLG